MIGDRIDPVAFSIGMRVCKARLMTALDSLTPAQLDRAEGTVLGQACGDALGAGYEFGPPLSASTEVLMNGGGTFAWAPGEWTDDTSMAIPLLQALAAGRDLRDDAVLDDIVAEWVGWAATAPDVGIQLRQILRETQPTASAVRVVARELHNRTGRSGGNGSLMRTSPVALGYLNDPVALAEAARAQSDLTHFDVDTGDACVLWSLAIRHTILTGELDVRIGIAALPAERGARWLSLIDQAERMRPAEFENNGWVVEALQAAWSAICQGEAEAAASGRSSDRLRLGLEAAVRGGRDTDTVAAIAGGMLGAAVGASAVPAEWRAIVHGWPGLDAGSIIALSRQAAVR